MTPREKLLALADRLDKIRPEYDPEPTADEEAAAKAIRVLVEQDHREERHAPSHSSLTYFTCSCGFSASGGLDVGINSCLTLREAAGGDDEA